MCVWIESRLSKTSGFALGLEQSEHVGLSDGSLDVTNDLSVRVVDELDFHLGTLTLRAGAAQHFDDARQSRLRFLVLRLVHFLDSIDSIYLERVYFKNSNKHIKFISNFSWTLFFSLSLFVRRYYGTRFI